MKQNTITTIDKLKPGDKFQLEKDYQAGPVFTKIAADPIVRRKHTHSYFAVRDSRIIPESIPKKTAIIYIGKSKKLIL